MGQYVGTLCLIVKKDLPRLFIVFAVINFSFGSGLYFSLLGHYNDEHVDIVNDNSTRLVCYSTQKFFVLLIIIL